MFFYPYLLTTGQTLSLIHILDDIRNIAANLPSTKTPATAGDSEGEGSDGTTQVLKDLRSVLVPTTSEILWGVINGDILQTVWNKVTSSTGSLVSIGVKQLAKVVGAVSYTHLDVYKRQAMMGAESAAAGHFLPQKWKTRRMDSV